MGLFLVDPRYLDTAWPKVVPFLAESIATALGDMTVDQLRMQLVRGEAALLIMEEDGEVTGAATVEFMNYPQRRVAFVTNLAGRGVVTEEAFRALSDWARENGASSVRAACHEAQARLYQRVGMRELYRVVGD